MIAIFLRSVLKFASALYLAGLSLIMFTALTHGTTQLHPDGLFPYEAALVLVLIPFQLCLFGSELRGILRK